MWSQDTIQLTRHSSTLTIGRIIANQAHIRADRTAIESPRGSLTYSEVDLRSNMVANELAARGLRAGDVVAVVSENSAELCVLLYAAAKIGVAVALLNWRQTTEETAYCLGLVDPRLVTASEGHEQHALDALGHLDQSGEFLPLGSIYEDNTKSLFGASSLRYEVLSDRYVSAEQILTIVYTSGTTGRPKAAAISHRALTIRALLSGGEFRLNEDDSFLAWAPMFHVASTDYMFSTHLSGGKFIVLPGFDSDAIVQKLLVERVGKLQLMPGVIAPMIASLKKSKERVAGVRAVGTLADLVPTDQLIELTALLDAPYVNGFGSTEAGTVPSARTLLPVGRAPLTLAKNQVGFCDVRLETERGTEAAGDEIGELLVRGPTLFSGYWNDDDATREAFRGGWYHSGDLFRRTASGALDFVARSRYMIKSGGENIYPAEIEKVLLQHPGVTEAVVVRRLDANWGEVPVAVIAVNGTTSADDVAGFCENRLARHKQPKHFIVWDLQAFPRNSTGKIVRQVVEDQLHGSDPASEVVPL